MINKSEVMKRAWKRFKRIIKNESVTFAECLRYAWDYFKSFEKKDVVFAELQGSEKQVKWAKSIQQEMSNELIKEKCRVISSLLKIKRQKAAKLVKFFLATEKRSWILIELSKELCFDNYKIWADALEKF